MPPAWRREPLLVAIKRKRRWYKGRPWHKKAAAWVSYRAYKIARDAEIAVAGAKIGELETANRAARLSLSVALEALKVRRW